MTTYTAFIGMWDDGDPDFTRLRKAGLSWEEARDVIIEELRSFDDATCQDCRRLASEELLRIRTAAPGRFEGAMNGDDYLILPEPI